MPTADPTHAHTRTDARIAFHSCQFGSTFALSMSFFVVCQVGRLQATTAKNATIKKKREKNTHIEKNRGNTKNMTERKQQQPQYAEKKIWNLNENDDGNYFVAKQKNEMKQQKSKKKKKIE